MDEASARLGVSLNCDPSFVLAQSPPYRPLRKTAAALAFCAVITVLAVVAPLATGIGVAAVIAHRLFRLTRRSR